MNDFTGYDSLYREQQDEVRTLKNGACFVGTVLLGCLVFQVIAAVIAGIPLQWAEENMTASVANRLLYYAIYSVYYCATLLLPAVIGALIFHCSPVTKKAQRRPIGAADGVLLVLFGMAVCILANYLVAYWLQFVSHFGVEPFEGSYHNDGGLLPLVLNLFVYALLPGVVEELVFRGWILGALRPFGEKTALVLSALLFGLAHSNLTQLPFAFILGLLFGYIFLRTGRLWPCMVIHAANNALSVALDYLQKNTALLSDEYVAVQIAVMVGIAFVGALAGLALFLAPASRPLVLPLREHRHAVPSGICAKWLWISPLPVAIAIYALSTIALEVLL